MPDPTRETKKQAIRQKVYGRRIGRPMRTGRLTTLEETLPDYLIEPDHLSPLDGFNSIWFEIGFGNGEHLLWQAQNNPKTLCIGCEPFLNGVTYLLKELEQHPLQNVRVFPDDARLILEALPDQCLDRLFVLHPDPWPKTRHHKRRFIQTEVLNEFSRLLKPGSELRMASDHPGVASWMLEKTFHHPDFEWSAQSCDNWRTRPADWPQTRYEQKGLEAGRKPYYLQFIRNNN